MDADFRSCALWTFSLGHYAKPGVKEACLRLQDEHRLDVNVALACLWHERRGGVALSSADLADLLDTVDVQRVRVLKIRPLRREAKRVSEALYRALKRSELLAENLLQLALCEALPAAADADNGGDGRVSLGHYAAHVSAALPPDLVEAFIA